MKPFKISKEEYENCKCRDCSHFTEMRNDEYGAAYACFISGFRVGLNDQICPLFKNKDK